MQIMQAYKQKVKSLQPLSKLCAIVFDEISIKSGLNYDSHNDCIEGLKDLGLILRRTRYVATSALVFMAHVLQAKWKQPIGYFLTISVVKSQVLKTLLLNAIDVAVNVSLSPCAVVCDQGSDKRSC